MLVLSRHRDESIMIGDDVVITIVDIRGDKVRLGIDAPKDIPVHRREVYEAIQRENKQQESAHDESNRAERSEEHTSELQSLVNLVCRLLLEKKKTQKNTMKPQKVQNK